MHPPVDLPFEQTRRFEHPQMFADRWKRHIKRLGEFLDHGFAASETGEDGAAGGVGKGTEGRV